MNGGSPSDQRPRIIEIQGSVPPGGTFGKSRSTGCGCTGCLGCLGTIAALLLVVWALDAVIAGLTLALPGFLAGAVCVLLLLGLFRLVRWLFS